MKIIKYTHILFTLLLFVSLASCGSDDTSGPSLQDLTFEKLAGNWTLSTNGSIRLDGQNVSANYAGFSLSFADGSYTTTNAGDLFRANGTWQFVGETAESISLDSGEEITVLELTETRFVFSFSSNGTGGTAAGIAGNYTITVVK